MKKLSAFLICSALLIGISGCSSDNQEVSEKPKVNTTENEVVQQNEKGKYSIDDKIIETVNSNADLIVAYKTLDDLANAAEIIVEGKVLETNSYVSGPGVVTEFTLEVSETFYGPTEKDSKITFINAGGIVPYAEAKEQMNVVQKRFEPELTETQKENGYLK